jgi:ubiquinone/menaquinone biosynthesis C-methylase UbiE
MPDSNIRDQVRVLTVAEGFFQSNVLFALLRLNVFEHMGEGTISCAELAEKLDVRPETLVRLLNAGVALKILTSQDGRTFRVDGPFRSALLPIAGTSYLGDWLLNLEYFRDALAHLDEAVRTSLPVAEFLEDAKGEREHTRRFTLAMHNYAMLRGKELARYLDTTGCNTLLDVGAGPGTYGFHLAETNPGLQLYLVDVPEVLEVAREVAMSFRISKPVTYLGLDLRVTDIEGTFDIILVSNTLHMLGEAESRRLLSKLFPHVSQGGSLVVQAQFLNDDHLGPRWPALLDLIQLCITEEGRNHTAGETKRWLEDAGFANVEYCPMALTNTNSFLRAWKH